MRKEIAILSDQKGATVARFKSNGIQPGFQQVKDHVSGRQSRMATELYLASAGKPPQIIDGPRQTQKKRSQKDYFLQRPYAVTRHLTSLEADRLRRGCR